MRTAVITVMCFSPHIQTVLPLDREALGFYGAVENTIRLVDLIR